MLFSVIYEIDTFDVKNKIIRYCPNNFKLWQCTERNDKENGYEEKGRHRKYIALLNKKQFEKFIYDMCLSTDGTEGSSVGAPGCGYSIVPNLHFYDDILGYDNIYLSASVTPLPEVKREKLTEKDWNRIKKAMISKYGM